MTAAAPLDPALESLLAFWAEAGVDAAVEDAPTDKLRRPEPPAPAVEPIRTAASPAFAFSGPGHGDLTGAVADAQDLAAAAADFESLSAAAESFAPGSLRPTGARRGVLGRGGAPADLAVIGGAPGADEERDGAFAGPAGRLLDRMLAAAGLADRALLLHAVLWRTPGAAAPSPEQATLSRPFIERAIALAQPRAVLILGEVPARLVLGRDESVLKLRRERLAWAQGAPLPELPTLVTFSPDFLLRASGAKKQAWHDFLTLAEWLDTANSGS